jgi:SnoaL-like domain
MKKLVALLLFTAMVTFAQTLTENEARNIIDGIYKGDFREAFASKNPELFLKYIPDDFSSRQVDGQMFNAEALRQFFPTRFTNQVRLVEHNVTIEDIDILTDGTISAIVTLTTLEEFSSADGNGTYFVTTIGTYRDDWQERDGQWYEIRGTQLRNQMITSPRP